MLIWSQEAFILALGLSLLHSLWQGALLGVLSAMAGSRLKRATPDTRYAVFGLLLLTVLAAWLCTLGCLYLSEARSTLSLAAGNTTASFSETALQASVPAESLLPWSPRWPLLSSLATLWSSGVLLLSLRHLCGVLALHRLRRVGTRPCPSEWQASVVKLAARMGLHRAILVRLCVHIDVPLTFGVVKSYILLPPSALLGLPPEHLEALIAHELAHIRQHDALINFFQICVETILFYHPVVWWLSAQIRVAREQRCDDLAVQAIGDHALYARALFSMEELRTSIPQLALGATGGNSHMSDNHLIQRIQRVLGINGPEKRAPWMAGVLALCTAAIGLATLWPVQAHSAPVPAHKADQPAAPKAQQDPKPNAGIETRVMININGKTFELNTLALTPDTKITVNGQETRFGDLNEQEQMEIQEAAQTAHAVTENGGADSSPTRRIEHKKIVINLNGTRFELNTFILTPDTKITVNGQETRFADLNEQEQMEIQAAIQQAIQAAEGSGKDSGAEMSRTGSLSQQHGALSPGVKRLLVNKTRVIVCSLKLGNDQVRVYGNALQPDTIVAINGVKTRYKSLPASRQKQLLAVWSRNNRLTRL